MTKPTIIKAIGTAVAFALGGVGAVFPAWLPLVSPIAAFILGAIHVPQPAAK